MELLKKVKIIVYLKGTLSWLRLASCDVEIKNKALAFEELPNLYAHGSYFVLRIKAIRSLSSS